MKGSCLCGAVTYETAGRPISFVFDHCSRCRKASGSAFKAEILVEAADFRWVSGQALVKLYEAPIRKTPPGYRSAFCTVCGGPVPIVDDRVINIPAGTLDDDPGLRPERHIFVASKAPWFEIADHLPRFSEK
jgi:hypothetical protein